MKKRVLISSEVTEVKSNGSITTKKPSTVSIAVDHRFAIEAQTYFMDEKSGQEKETGLVGFELIAIYEDGEFEGAENE